MNEAPVTSMSKPSFGTKIPVRATRNAEVEEGSFSLFSSIVTESIPTIPSMPSELVQYDISVSNEISRLESEAVFFVWLKSQMNGRPLMPDAETKLICQEAENVNIFFPEWPDENDFRQRDEAGAIINHDEDVLSNFEYNRLWALANIDTAKAKSECSACPARIQCLAKSIVLDQTEDGSGVWGGWGQGGRHTIQGKFNALRRYYQAGRRSMDAALSEDEYKGMPADAVKKAEQRARELVTF